jgi:hypothetical protein
MSRITNLRTAGLAALVTAILAPGAALAQPIDPPRTASVTAIEHGSTVLPLGVRRAAGGVDEDQASVPPIGDPAAPIVEVAGSGFAWGDAAIGAAAMFAALALGTGVVVAARRSRQRGHPVAAA